MRVGKFEVSEELLEEVSVTDFICGCDILDVRPSFNLAGCVEFLAEHEEFEDINEGDVIPTYSVWFEKVQNSDELKRFIYKVK